MSATVEAVEMLAVALAGLDGSGCFAHGTQMIESVREPFRRAYRDDARKVIAALGANGFQISEIAPTPKPSGSDAAVAGMSAASTSTADDKPSEPEANSTNRARHE